MHFKLFGTFALISALVACSIKQDVIPVTPVAATDVKQVCIIENPAVRETFLPVYQRNLESKGYTVRILAPRASTRECPMTSTYTARWSWDFTIYMSIAEITVYQDGQRSGYAKYDSRAGGMRLDKWVNAEQKINELVDQLFPN
ncbi:MAG: hypothetical protein JNM47_07500 [Hyphomonadaceae bacterium]|nr:hypothetical protein [Hyphomonadaceae bacterium]